jgi:hypothetical protein
MILGINCTKTEVAIAKTSDSKSDFLLIEVKRFLFSLNNAKDCTDLYGNLKALISASATEKDCCIAILSCGSGTHGSSVEAIKAEAIVELICDALSLSISQVKPQSLKSALECEKGERWQTKAKDMFNPEGKFPYFSKGSDGAVTAAFKIATP